MATDYLPQPHFYQAWRLAHQQELSDEALRRWDLVQRFNLAMSGSLTSQEAAVVLRVPRSTLYRWRALLKKYGPRGLEPKSRRPHKVAERTVRTPKLARSVEALCKRYPAWGKAKICRMLPDQIRASESTVGRVMTSLRRRGVIRYCPRRRMRFGRRKTPRLHAQRLPRGERLHASKPGQVLQLDTLKVNFPGGTTVVQFNAVDVCSRWAATHIATRATAKCGADFLDAILAQCPFPVRALQVDGGSEFMAEFEAAAMHHGIHLAVLAPRSPELNGRVERINGTWRRELYAVADLPSSLQALRPHVMRFRTLYNHVRPHQALGYLTPAEYLRRHHPDCAPQSHMS
jgi:transposase InsO family protein